MSRNGLLHETPPVDAQTAVASASAPAPAPTVEHIDSAAYSPAAHADTAQPPPGTTDRVTGLLNRNGALSAYRTHASNNTEIVVVHVDLEGFQTINHMHGYEQGDAVLSVLADRLRGLLPPSAAIARINGQELLLLVEGDNLHGQYVSKRVEDMCEQPIPLTNGGQASLSARIGWIAARASMEADLLRGATFALHEAKVAGVRRTEFDQTMATEIAHRKQTQIDLRSAIAQDQFELYGQTIVDVYEDRVQTIDLMLRWNHPTRGLLSADQFLPIAEDCDLIDDIDRWVVHNLCAYAALTHPTVHFSINLSMQSIAKPSSLKFMLDTINDSGVPAGRLNVDLGQSNRPVDIEAVIEATNQLIANGIGVSIDRFGHGYGSLATMMQMSVTAIKLDRSLTALAHTSAGRGVASAIIAFARQRGLEVIAGGVETAEQADTLRELGCRLQQGYFHQRPTALSGVLAHLPKSVDKTAH